MRTMLRSKIHRARVTEVNLDYEGSITIDERLMREADLLPHEQVHVLNLNNGARLTTYVITGRHEGEICLNGASARLAAKGDTVIILSYCQVEEDEAQNFRPRVVRVNARNSVVKTSDPLEAIRF